MEKPHYPVPATAVALPFLALSTIIIDIPPLVWHIRNKNFPAASLVLWILQINFMTFINALIWPTDDIATWWHGKGLCDVEIKLSTATYIGVVGSLIGIMRNLAFVLDTKNTVITLSKARKRRILIIDLLLCLGGPIYMMLAHYIVQPNRYWIQTVMGCIAPYDASWPSVVLVFLWPPLLSAAIVYYSVVVVYRLRKYRQEFSSILSSSSSNLTKNRFMRLFVMSLSLLAVLIPAQIYVLYRFALGVNLPYDWNLVHGVNWGDIILIPTGGTVFFDRWIQIGFGFAIFAFFGMGHDAQEMYRRWLLHVGMGRIFPTLRLSTLERKRLKHSTGSQTNFQGSRAHFLAKKFSRSSIRSFCSKKPYLSGSTLTASPTSEHKPFGKLSPVSEQSRFTSSQVTMTTPAATTDTTELTALPVVPASAHPSSNSWLHTFVNNERRTAPNRRMAAGLGIFGAATLPRDGAVTRLDHYHGASAV